MQGRDDFTPACKQRIADRVGHRCSNPRCRAPVKGPKEGNDIEAVNVGSIAHITAAAKGGPRYDSTLTSEQRRAESNGILLCNICAKWVDDDPEKYTVELLREWKTESEKMALEVLGVPEAKVDEKIKKLVADAVREQHVPEPNLELLLEVIERFINEQKGATALSFIQPLQGAIWSLVSDAYKYKILRLKGLAQLQIGEGEGGAQSFIEALGYNPKFDKAHSNAAWAYSILKKKKEAIQNAQKAIAIDPENIRGHCILVENLPQQEADKITETAPQSVKEHPEFCMSLARRANENFPEAEKWLRKAISIDPANAIQPKAMLAEVLILRAMRGRPYADKEELSKEEESWLREAKSLMEETYDSIHDSDNRKIVLMTKTNLSAVNGSLGNFAEALRHLEDYLRMDPKNFNHQMRKIELLRHLNRTEEAESELRKLHDPKSPDKASLMFADVLRMNGELEEAEKVAKGFLASEQSAELQRDANGLLIQTYIDGGKFLEASKKLTTLLEKNEKDIGYLMDAANVERLQGNIDASLIYVQRAEEALEENSPFIAIRRVADGYYSLGKFKEAASLYEHLTDKKAPTNTVQRLLNCYYQIGRHKDALEICRTVKEASGPLSFIAEVESDIYERIGDLPKAQKALADYIKEHPGDGHLTIRLARLYARANEFEKIDELLPTVSDAGKLGIEDSFLLARFHLERGKPHKAFSIAYEARRRFAKKAEAHLNYITFFHLADKVAIERPETIGKDCIVFVENEGGGEDTYIIEEQERDGPDTREISLDDPRAIQMKGKRVGDNFSLVRNSWGEEKAKIKGILNKYVYAYQESGKEYARMKPNNTVFSTIPAYDGEEKEGEMPKALQTILKLAEQRELRARQLEELYEQKKMPLGMFAEKFGKDAIETWSNFAANPRMKVACCIGNTEEINSSGECFRGKDGRTSDVIPIIDITALLTLNYLGAERYLQIIFPKIGVAQTTKELIEGKIIELQKMPPSGYIGKDGYTEVKPESVATEIQKLQKMLDWLNANCTVFPVNAALELPEGRREKLNDLIGEEFVDTVLIASEPGRCLYSDDLLLRVLAKNEFGVRGFWTQLMLMRAEKLNIIEKEEYGRMGLELLKLGYDYTSINEDVLVMAAREDDWKPNKLYMSVLDTLKTAEPGSLLRMMTSFLFELMHEPLITPFLRENLIITLLNTVVPQKNRDAFIKQLIAMLGQRFGLSTLRLQEVASIIIQWRESQPL